MTIQKNYAHQFILDDAIFVDQLKIIFDHRFYYYSLRVNNFCLVQDDTPEALFAHYLNFGIFHNVDCSLMFDSFYYLTKYQDVQDVGYPAIYHFLKYGAHEQRKPIVFFDYAIIADQIDYDFSKNNILLDMYSTLLGVDLTPTILFDFDYLREEENGIASNHGTVGHKNKFLSYLYNTSMWELDTHKMIDSGYIRKQYPKVCNLSGSSVCLPPLLMYFKFPKVIRPHPKFDPIFYENNYTVDTDIDPLTCFVKLAFEKKQCPAPDVNTDVISCLPEVCDSSDYFSYLSSKKDCFYVFNDESASSRILYAMLSNKVRKTDENCSIKYIFILPFFIRGGAEKVVSAYVAVLTSFVTPESILIVTTESDNHSAQSWLPPGVNILDISFISCQSRVNCLFLLLRFYSPEHVHICNSETGWSCVETYGEILKEQTILTGNFFAFQFNDNAEVSGFIFKYFKTVTPFLHAILTDNNRVIKDMYEYFPNLASDRTIQIKKIHQPVETTPEKQLPSKKSNKFKILWTGRLAKEKLIDTVFSVAKSLSDFEFHIFGENFDINSAALSYDSPENVVLRGPYLFFSEIIANEHFDCFLFTSKWEGLPNVLLEAMGCRLPIVASCVGGVQEVIFDNITGLLVFNATDPREYVEKILHLANDQNLCMNLGCNAQAFVQEHHNFQVFYKDVVCSFLHSNMTKNQQFFGILPR